MGKLSAGQWLEAAFWIGFAVLAYTLSFQFDREIEMYRFGAAGWPRVVLVLIFLAAIGQIVQDLQGKKWGKRLGPAGAVAGYPGETAQRGVGSVGRIGIILALPVIYASLLEYTGYYVTTPIFLAAYLYVTGERRARRLIAVPLSIYVVLTILFTRFLYVSLPVGYWPGFYDFSNWLIVLIRF